MTSVRRWRRDLAILRTIGFTRAQTRRTVTWQAATLGGTALVIGVPLGILGGRLAWQALAHQLGILPVVDVPPLWFTAFVPAALGVAVAHRRRAGKVGCPEAACRRVPQRVAGALPGESAA